jgi:death-on-curing protein
MNWITLLDLVIIHERVIEETGGVNGVTNPGGLESALARPFTSFEEIALFPDLVSKVAALIHSIIAFHPFADGNKQRLW